MGNVKKEMFRSDDIFDSSGGITNNLKLGLEYKLSFRVVLKN